MLLQLWREPTFPLALHPQLKLLMEKFEVMVGNARLRRCGVGLGG